MAEYTIDKFTYDGNTYKLKSSTLKNLVDGSQTGSVRGINTAAEDSNYTIGYGAVAVGISTKASGSGAFAEGGGTQAIAITAHAEGSGTTASGEYSHAEGGGTTASGSYSHAEGSGTTASGSHSHAEGSSTSATGQNSHAEGVGTNATGQYSHAEGYYNTTGGFAAHAEGNQTTANHAYQHVFGSYNIADDSTATATNKGNYIEIVGNGTSSSSRSNARTLDWSGNETLSGKLTLGVAGVNSMDAATVGQIPSVPTNVSSFTNDAGYITGYTETDPVFSASAAHGISSTDITNWNSKQAALVSGTNIKTINGSSLLGSGDITIQAGSKTTWYGTCNSAGNEQDKAVVCSNFALENGAIITVDFRWRNSNSSPRLNVNSTGAKNIVGQYENRFWNDNTAVTFMYANNSYILLSTGNALDYQFTVQKYDFGADYNNAILAGTTSCTIDCSSWRGEFGVVCVASVNAFMYDMDNDKTEGVIVDWEASGTDVIASIASAVDYDIVVQVLLTQGSGTV